MCIVRRARPGRAHHAQCPGTVNRPHRVPIHDGRGERRVRSRRKHIRREHPADRVTERNRLHGKHRGSTQHHVDRLGHGYHGVPVRRHRGVADARAGECVTRRKVKKGSSGFSVVTKRKSNDCCFGVSENLEATTAHRSARGWSCANDEPNTKAMRARETEG